MNKPNAYPQAKYDLLEISDRLEIYDLYDRYAHAVDEQDIETLEGAVFSPDVRIDWSDAGGILATWEDAKREIYEVSRFEKMCHLSGNHRIDFLPGRMTAKVKMKMLNPVIAEGAEGQAETFQTTGNYLDTLARTEDGWRIVHRQWTMDWAVGPLGIIEDGLPGIFAAASSLKPRQRS